MKVILHRSKLIGTAWLVFAISFLCIGEFSRVARAQERPKSSTGLEVLPLRPNFYVIAGAGANISVQTGPDGVVVVDAGVEPAADQVLAIIQSLTDQPIRYIINTSADPDHVGGNEKLAKAGLTLFPLNDPARGEMAISMTNGGAASILAAENVLMRMSAPTGQKSLYPTGAWPTESYNEKRKYMYLNGEAIETLRQPAAHSDGDSIVFFRRSDVIAAGDVLDTTRFPAVDVAHGGSIQGEIDALNRMVEIAVPSIPLVWKEGGTYIVPGHGRIYDQNDLVEYRDMITITRDAIQEMIEAGMTLEQIKAASPTKAYNPQFGRDSGPWTTNMYVEAVYKSLTAKK